MDKVDTTSKLIDQFMMKCSKKLIPVVVQFEITHKCNLSCRHCNVVKQNDKELTTAEIKGVIDQLKEMGTFFLAFTGGEIFTRSDFSEIAWYAKKKGFILIFMTNATLITPEKMEEIKKIKPRNFEISLLGANAKTHDYITRVDGSFDRTIEAIKELTEAGIEVITKTALMSLNVKEYNEIRALSKRLGAVPIISPLITPKKDGSLEPQSYELSFEEVRGYLPDEPPDPAYFFRWESQNKSKLCNAGKATCCISPNGDVHPCVLLPLKIGNLKNQGFKDIWLNQPNKNLKKLRDLTERDLTECLDCNLGKFCHRCAGLAYLETGNLTGPSPISCRQAKWARILERKSN
jgi:radical SAM protein with 4Fe4S-binding SPASM domain